MSPTILILGGTNEAFALAQALVERNDFRVISSLAGRTQNPRLPPGEVVQGGFGGSGGLAEFLRNHGVNAMVDATHPFAARMGAQAAEAAAMTATKLLRLERPAWLPQDGDRWQMVDDWDQAAATLEEAASRVLLAIGRQELDAFTRLRQIHFLIRSVERPDPWPDFHQATFIAARGPFSVEDETALLLDHGIDTILCKNSGGEASMPKLTAARSLGIRVVMRQRPPRPPVETAAGVNQVVDWLTRLPSPGR